MIVICVVRMVMIRMVLIILLRGGFFARRIVLVGKAITLVGGEDELVQYGGARR